MFRPAWASFCPRVRPLGNPVDMIATASAADYRRTLEALIETEACDVIIAIFVTALATTAADVATAVREVAERNPAVAIAAVFMVSGGIPSELSSPRLRVPGYEFPEDCGSGRGAGRPARAMARPRRRLGAVDRGPPLCRGSRHDQPGAGSRRGVALARLRSAVVRVLRPSADLHDRRTRRGASGGGRRRGSAYRSRSRPSRPGWCTRLMPGACGSRLEGADAVRAAAVEIERAVRPGRVRARRPPRPADGARGSGDARRRRARPQLRPCRRLWRRRRHRGADQGRVGSHHAR